MIMGPAALRISRVGFSLGLKTTVSFLAGSSVKATGIQTE